MPDTNPDLSVRAAETPRSRVRALRTCQRAESRNGRLMSHMLSIEPLTREAFAPFGSVIEADPASMRFINGGNTERFHALARVDAAGEGAGVNHQHLSRATPGFSLFRDDDGAPPAR